MVRTPLHGSEPTRSYGLVGRWQAWATVALLVLSLIVAPVTLMLDGDASPFQEYPTLSGLAVATLVVAVPLLAGGLVTAAQESMAGYAAWLGALAFAAYVWATFALTAPSLELLLVHVALLALALFAFAAGIAAAPADAIASSLEGGLPRTAVAIVLAAWAALLALAWIVPVAGALAGDGELVPLLRETVAPEVLLVLDLAILAPAAAVVSRWLFARRTWGFVAVGVVLVTLSCLGVAVLASVGTAYVAGESAPVLPTVVAAVLTAAAIGGGAFVVGALGGDSQGSGWEPLGRA